MNKEQKCALLEYRLNKLVRNKKDNQGVCRRINREIRNLRKSM